MDETEDANGAADAGWFADATTESTQSGITYLEALRRGLEDSLAENERVILMGEDIGIMGGAFRVTAGLYERFGPRRVIDTPMAETALVGSAIGLAIRGWLPIVELQFADFISCAYDQLVNEAAKLHYRFGIAVPVVIRCPAGGGLGAGPFHSQCPEGVFAHIPGLKIVCPATVQDAYSLIRASVDDPDPVLFFEQKALYRSLKEPLERNYADAALGKAVVRRPGKHLTIVAYGSMLRRALAAGDLLANEGIEAEVIDLRTLVPLDFDSVAASLQHTGRLLLAHEDTRTSGFAAEVAARVAESVALFDLDAPIARVTAPDVPVPFSKVLEERYVPSVDRIVDCSRQLVAA
jgi:2-oxoisovalerate dehydrogenase E1 component beta subunit